MKLLVIPAIAFWTPVIIIVGEGIPTRVYFLKGLVIPIAGIFRSFDTTKISAIVAT